MSPTTRKSTSSKTPGTSGSSKSDIYDNKDSLSRYEAFSRLQAAAVALGDTLPIPEIVAIGGQSDGKSSLLEAFLGFRFNVREVEMGTRRPLIVQMKHDPSATEPRCRLQEEDSEEYGPPIMPETAVADAIQKRTENHLRKLGGVSVSAKPIVMRAEYAYCPNLTIIDTPGFILKARNGEADSTPEDIMAMVKAQAAPAHRLILFLQQSSVEWASSLWMHVVQEVDPHFKRTVIVASKFDNRLKEFGERWEVDKYLSASGYLAPSVRPFFVALPKDRQLQSSSEWRHAMQEVDAGVFQHLREAVKGGFDEERFASRIGFGNLRRFLEDELARRYREAAPATLALLQERCSGVAAELMAADSRLRNAEDVASMRRAAMKHAAAVAEHVRLLLSGSTEPDPEQYGMTTEEERAASRTPQWPGVAGSVQPPNNVLKLFGGAAFERCLDEFQEAAHALSFPAVARDKVANVLLAYKGKNHHGGAARAAEDIARQTARELLGPLLDAACSRLALVIRRVFDIAVERAAAASGSSSSSDSLKPYVAFHAALRAAHQAFVAKTEEAARALVHHHLASATSEFALNLMASMSDFWDDEVEAQGQQAPRQGGEDGEEARENAGSGRQDGGAPRSSPLRASQLTVPETPTPDLVAQQAAAKALSRRVVAGVVLGPGRHVDGSPGKGRLSKSRRVDGQLVAAGSALFDGRGTYDDVTRYSERLFAKIRQTVACQQCPTTLKAAFLDPVAEQLALEVQLELFAKPDAEFMGMFTAAGVLAALQAKREALQRRAEILLKSKTEFQEITRCL